MHNSFLSLCQVIKKNQKTYFYHVFNEGKISLSLSLSELLIKIFEKLIKNEARSRVASGEFNEFLLMQPDNTTFSHHILIP